MANTKPFSRLPPNASSSITPFTISFPPSDLSHLRTLLELTPLHSTPSYESSLPSNSRTLGLPHSWLTTAKQTWQTTFSWPTVETHLNTFPHFTTPLSDPHLGAFQIHFVALFSTRSDAIPIILLHGWPGNFMEFLPILTHLKTTYADDPAKLPYHIIIPSLPGYTFSHLPSNPAVDFSQVDCARIFNTLATSLLGFKRYIVQGGDVGSRVARCMGVAYDACVAVHLNFCGISKPSDEKLAKLAPLSKVEEEGLKRWEDWRATGMAYAMEHATKPATIGLALASSPVALLAWIGEKMLDWTDEDPSIQTVLEFVTLYWLTGCAHTNLWSYRHSYGPQSKPHDHPDFHLRKPLGYSYFPKELIPIPVSWVATTTDELVFSRVHERGGHFAALERPGELWRDVEEFVGRVWK